MTIFRNNAQRQYINRSLLIHTYIINSEFCFSIWYLFTNIYQNGSWWNLIRNFLSRSVVLSPLGRCREHNIFHWLYSKHCLHITRPGEFIHKILYVFNLKRVTSKWVLIKIYFIIICIILSLSCVRRIHCQNFFIKIFLMSLLIYLFMLVNVKNRYLRRFFLFP